MKHFLQFIVVLGIITFIVCGISIITQMNITHVPVASWENWISGISILASGISGILQLSAVQTAFHAVFSLVWQGLVNFSRHIKALPRWVNMVLAILVILVLLLTANIFFPFKQIINGRFVPPTSIPTPTPNPSFAASVCLTAQKAGIQHGLGVKLKGNDCVGLSDGNALFDENHNIKYVNDALLAVGEDIKDPHSSQTQGGWDQATQYDKTNAEPLIYDEDIHILQDAQHPHVTIVVVAILTGIYYNDGRDVLQGVYLQQKEHNDACKYDNYSNCPLLNVIIANVGSGLKDEADYAKQVADQIRKAEQNDATIIGVMSGINSQGTINLNDELNKSGATPLPIIAAKATYDNISGQSNLFRVVPPDSVQAQTASDYAKSLLPPVSRVAVLYRKGDTYAFNLAQDFSNDFPSADDKYQLAYPLPKAYTPRNSGSLITVLQEILQDQHPPDALYCACFANEVNTILQQLANYPHYKQLLIFGGDALYELGDYTPDTRAQMYRLRFTSFTYPDIWSILQTTTTDQPPTGLNDYKKVYGKSAGDGQYGTTRMTPGTSVSYDAMLVFMTSCNKIFASQGSVSASALENSSNGIMSLKNVTGISGHITFGQATTSNATNDPYNKIIVVIQVVLLNDDTGKLTPHFQYANFYEGSL